ncbi:lysozyme inhibitor LprI family protein [Pseudomonas piscis]|uniref:DUF1311 domain-containing protein n=1 Tax=Pseudomonas piscis TaxID=2614538 RepID=A0A7X1PTC9_9PSED|nr:lysozyme inhibitor LprI family protein [Pseudomonas piscis]MQA57920.1 DUF1311 domain-containing protein [Pseudomonas piscis]WMN15902.1 lysozyme inhibitor LprI family protein [Pseudomonas piscis]
MRPTLILFLAPMLLAPLAHASECSDAPDQAALSQCASLEYKTADKELNSLYQQISQGLKNQAQTKQRLVGAQRAWVAFRDAECGYATSGVEGGSLYPLAYSQCMTALTKARVENFKNYLKCEEGDLSCPVLGR